MHSTLLNISKSCFLNIPFGIQKLKCWNLPHPRLIDVWNYMSGFQIQIGNSNPKLATVEPPATRIHTISTRNEVRRRLQMMKPLQSPIASLCPLWLVPLWWITVSDNEVTALRAQRDARKAVMCV